MLGGGPEQAASIFWKCRIEIFQKLQKVNVGMWN
jgi:hypothetical protein